MRIKNINDEFIDIEVIRYFRDNENDYLIYSVNETDESGYIKLYASKIIDSKACIIVDNDEWDFVKQVIKEIVRNNRDGNELNISDLDEKKLEDIVLQDTRIFKLQGNLVTLLSENKNIISEEEIEEEQEEVVQEEIIEENLDYEKLYNDQLEKNNLLQSEIESLKQELSKHQDRITQIKAILEMK